MAAVQSTVASASNPTSTYCDVLQQQQQQQAHSHLHQSHEQFAQSLNYNNLFTSTRISNEMDESSSSLHLSRNTNDDDSTTPSRTATSTTPTLTTNQSLTTPPPPPNFIDISEVPLDVK
ncbi:hypothetical protein ACFFRR_000486 [Megaselia abdita]